MASLSAKLDTVVLRSEDGACWSGALAQRCTEIVLSTVQQVPSFAKYCEIGTVLVVYRYPMKLSNRGHIYKQKIRVTVISNLFIQVCRCSCLVHWSSSFPVMSVSICCTVTKEITGKIFAIARDIWCFRQRRLIPCICSAFIPYLPLSSKHLSNTRACLENVPCHGFLALVLWRNIRDSYLPRVACLKLDC